MQRLNKSPTKPGIDEQLNKSLIAWLAAAGEFQQSILMSVCDGADPEKVCIELDEKLIATKKQLISHLANHRLCEKEITEDLSKLPFYLANVATIVVKQADKSSSELNRCKTNAEKQKALCWQQNQDKQELSRILKMIEDDTTSYIPFDKFDFNQLVKLMGWTEVDVKNWQAVKETELAARDGMITRYTQYMVRFVTWTNKHKLALVPLIKTRLVTLKNESEQKAALLEEHKKSLSTENKQSETSNKTVKLMNDVHASMESMNTLATLIKSMKDITLGVNDAATFLSAVSVKGCVIDCEAIRKKQAQLQQYEDKFQEICISPQLYNSRFALNVSRSIARVKEGLQRVLTQMQTLNEVQNETTAIVSTAAKLIIDAQSRPMVVMAAKWELDGDTAEQLQKVDSARNAYEKIHADYAAFVKHADIVATQIVSQIDKLKKLIKKDTHPALIQEMIIKLQKQSHELSACKSGKAEMVEKQQYIVRSLESANTAHQNRLKHQRVIEKFKKNLDGYKSAADLLKDFSVFAGVMLPCDDSIALFGRVLTKLNDMKKSVASLSTELDCATKFIVSLLDRYNDRRVVSSLKSNESLISILRILNLHNIKLQENTLTIARKLLDFSKNYPVISDDLLVCAQAGIDINHCLAELIKSKVVLEWRTDDVEKLLHAITKNKGVDSQIVKNLEDILSKMKSERNGNEYEFNANLFAKQIENCVNMHDLLIVFRKHKDLLHANIQSMNLFADIFRKITQLYQAQCYVKQNDDIAEIMHEFNAHIFAFGPAEQDKLALHNATISIIGSLNLLHIAITPELKAKLQESLQIDLLFLHAKDQVCKHIFVCAKMGIDIKDAVTKLMKMVDMGTMLRRGDLAMLLFSCYMHDANCGPGQTLIDPENIKAIFAAINQANIKTNNKACLFYRDGVSSYRGVDDARCLLFAEAFYRSKLDTRLHNDLSKMIKDEGENNTSSPKQLELYEILKNAFKDDANIEIKLEGIVLDCLHADIRIVNKMTGKIYDIEYDGIEFHYYKQSNFEPVRPLVLIRENNARDKMLQSHGIEVFRLTFDDLNAVSNSSKLANLIAHVRHESGLSASKAVVVNQ